MNNYLGMYYRYYLKRGSDFAFPHSLGSGNYGRISGYSPDVIKRHYSFPSSSFSGSGIKIGIVDAYGSPTIIDDTNLFSTTYGLPRGNISIVNFSNEQNLADEWILETSLDVQWAHATAPDAEIICYFAKSDDFTDIFEAIERAADECDIVSLSFGKREFAGEVEYEKMLSGRKCIFVCSSGDTSDTFYPAASEHVLSVGGTSVYFTSTGTATGEETVWSSTGCGISKYISIPEYQRNMADARTLSNGMRCIPDIAFFANGAYGVSIYHSTPTASGVGWTDVRGTSIGAPCVAGICALLLQKQRSVSDDIHSFIYSLAGGTRYTNTLGAFYDVTMGSSGAFPAKAGFDLCSGLGTPVVSRWLSATS